MPRHLLSCSAPRSCRGRRVAATNTDDATPSFGRDLKTDAILLPVLEALAEIVLRLSTL